MEFRVQLKKFSDGFFTDIFLEPKSGPFFQKIIFDNKKFSNRGWTQIRKQKKIQKNFVFRVGTFYFKSREIPGRGSGRNNRPAGGTIDQLTEQPTS